MTHECVASISTSKAKVFSSFDAMISSVLSNDILVYDELFTHVAHAWQICASVWRRVFLSTQ